MPAGCWAQGAQASRLTDRCTGTGMAGMGTDLERGAAVMFPADMPDWACRLAEIAEGVPRAFRSLISTSVGRRRPNSTPALIRIA